LYNVASSNGSLFQNCSSVVGAQIYPVDVYITDKISFLTHAFLTIKITKHYSGTIFILNLTPKIKTDNNPEIIGILVRYKDNLQIVDL